MQRTLLFAIVTVISYVTAAGIGSKELSASWPVVSGSIGYQQITVPDPDGKPLQVAIWYPSSASPSLQPLGLFQQAVAPKGALTGDRLPLVLISHGVGGSLASHYDTALALAQAGFVVVAVTHTGDNSQDQSYVGNRRDLIDRPQQISHVLDFILGAWPERTQLDPTRIGIFGFSLGGFTALVTIGGIPDLSRIPKFCSNKPEAPECRFIKVHHGDQLSPSSVSDSTWIHDARIKAAVAAAPAVSFTFAAGGLRHVKVPVQLWRADEDQESPNPWNSDIVRDGLPTPPEVHNVTKAGHFAFLAPCSEALAKAVPRICQDARDFDRSAFHRNLTGWWWPSSARSSLRPNEHCS
jgi:predicted dienelactone hydrolase